jgi:glutamate dehydrogenase (NAD(P)+)
LTRLYTSEIGVVIGPQQDIPAPDVNTDERIMAWMMDTYSMNQGVTTTGVVTGKPLALGGSLGRRESTGRGVFMVGASAARHIGLDLVGARLAVQGFGNVGSVAAQCFVQAGARLVAVQDHSGTVYEAAGMDVSALMDHVANQGGVHGFAGASALVNNEAFWDTPCDILIPAALEGQITQLNAHRISARMVLEGANGPTTPQADDILAQRGVCVVPDVLANAGGVTVSYFEWVQDASSYFWSEADIAQKLEAMMQQSFDHVWQVAQEKAVSLRTATFIVACTRILQARDLRGLYP